MVITDCGPITGFLNHKKDNFYRMKFTPNVRTTAWVYAGELSVYATTCNIQIRLLALAALWTIDRAQPDEADI